MPKNHVLSKFMAVIDGNKTGLTGCIKNCTGCIRADSKLLKQNDFNRFNKPICNRFISYWLNLRQTSIIFALKGSILF